MATTTRTRKAVAKPALVAVPSTDAMPATKTRKPAAKAEAKPAAQPEATEAAPSTEAASRAAKAKATREEAVASGETRVCEGEGACGKELPITSFPTTTRIKDGVMGRGKECRKCRNARRAANKAA